MNSRYFENELFDYIESLSPLLIAESMTYTSPNIHSVSTSIRHGNTSECDSGGMESKHSLT